MELKDILNLVNAGFTKEEIIALSATQQNAVSKEQEQAPAEVSAPVTEPKKEPELDAQAKQIEALNASIGELSEKIRQMNMLTAVMPENAVKQTTPGDLIGKIINPYTKKEV